MNFRKRDILLRIFNQRRDDIFSIQRQSKWLQARFWNFEMLKRFEDYEAIIVVEANSVPVEDENTHASV